MCTLIATDRICTLYLLSHPRGNFCPVTWKWHWAGLDYITVIYIQVTRHWDTTNRLHILFFLTIKVGDQAKTKENHVNEFLRDPKKKKNYQCCLLIQYICSMWSIRSRLYSPLIWYKLWNKQKHPIVVVGPW